MLIDTDGDSTATTTDGAEPTDGEPTGAANPLAVPVGGALAVFAAMLAL